MTTDPTKDALTAHVQITPDATEAGTVIASFIHLPDGTITYDLFGMKLVDVNPILQQSFHLFRPDGVLVLDPGNNSHGLNLQRGDQFWIVGQKPVKDFTEFASRLRAEGGKPDVPVRVVYIYSRPESSGTNTQHLSLSAADIAALAAIK